MSSLSAQALNRLDGVDLNGALARCGGDRSVLVLLLQRFVRERANFAQQFQTLYTQEPDSARRTAHSLCGLAGNLGMAELAALAAELERQVAQSAAAPSVAQALRGLEDLRQPLFGRIQLWLDELPQA